MTLLAIPLVRRAAVAAGRLAFAVLTLMSIARSHAATTVEDELKAVFLFNFASFVEWPESPGSARTDFVIGILGEDPFGPLLDQVVAGEQVHGRPMIVQRYPGPDDLDTCDILFVSRSEAGHLRDIFARLHGQPVLTVGDLPDFAESGGMIGFSTDAGRIRLNINRVAAESARLTVNAKLLRLARVVRPRE